MASIFISYRRGATEDITYRIYEKLKEHFGDVFIDIDNIPAGVRFPDHLASVLEVCDVVLAIIGPDWLNPRLTDPDDFLRQELEVAIERELTVIPILVRGASIPRLDQVPTSLINLLELQAVTVASASDFAAHIKRLIINIESGRTRAALAAEATRAALAAEAARAALAAQAEELRKQEEAHRLRLEAQERMKEEADERQLREAEKARSMPTRTAGHARFHVLGSVGSDLLTEHFVAENRGLEGFQKRVIIRRLHPRLSDKKRFVGMFLDEARLAGHLNHANVHSIIDVGEGADSYFCVYDYLDYESLKTIVSHGNGKALDIFVSAYICREVCRALEYAHSATNGASALGIIHRDITPANIYLVSDGRVVLSGFGMAKAATQLEESEPGDMKGKFSYLSPEVAKGAAATAASDLFSLGIVLWELVAGRRLFSADSDLAVVRMIQGFVEPPPLRRLRPGYEGQLDSVLSSLMAPDPGRRSDARQARAGLEAVLRLAAAYVTVDDVSTLVAEHRTFHGRTLDRFLEPAAHGLTAQSSLEFRSIEAQAGSPTSPPVVAEYERTGIGHAGSSTRWKGILRALLIVAGAVALGGVTAWAARYGSPSPSPSPPPAVLAATVTPPVPPSQPSAVKEDDGPEREVALVLFPLDARVLLGETDLGSMPVSVKVREGNPVKVRIVRDGYWTRKVTLDGTKKRVVVGLVKRDGSAAPDTEDDDPRAALPRAVPP